MREVDALEKGDWDWSAIFHPAPQQWGLRGDPYVWDAIKSSLASEPAPLTAEDAMRQLDLRFRDVVGVDLNDADLPTTTYREEFAHDGMSTGMVALDVWRDRLLPLLNARARRLLG